MTADALLHEKRNAGFQPIEIRGTMRRLNGWTLFDALLVETYGNTSHIKDKDFIPGGPMARPTGVSLMDPDDQRSPLRGYGPRPGWFSRLPFRGPLAQSP